MISDSEEITGKIVNILAYQAVITAQGESYTGEKDWALNKLRDLFKEELQKARQDWLRQEIVRLEGMKMANEHNSECLHNEAPEYCDCDNYIKWNKALQTIIDRYNEELNQPTSPCTRLLHRTRRSTTPCIRTSVTEDTRGAGEAN